MPPRGPKRMKMSASKDSEQQLEPGKTPTPPSSEEAHGSVDDGPSGSTTDTLAVPTDASIPPVVPSVHSMIVGQIPPSCTKRKDQPPTYPPVFLQHISSLNLIGS
ncbi:uncharacterized protein LOC144627813 [Crassostrea virginica]